MKKIIVYLVFLSMILIAGFQLRKYGFFSRCNYITAVYDFYWNEAVIFYVFDDPNLYNARLFLSHKYKVQYRCTKEDYPLNGIVTYQTYMETKLRKQLGEKKYKIFQHEKDSLYFLNDTIFSDETLILE